MHTTDVLIIGGGPAGYHLALHLHGKSVVLAEQNALGGTCLNVGCVPSKTLLDATNKIHQAQNGWNNLVSFSHFDFHLPQLHQHKNAVIARLNKGIAAMLKQNKIQHIVGKARVLGKKQMWQVQINDEIFQAEHLVVASGSSPKVLPELPFDHQVVWDSSDALHFQNIPQSLAVIGGGAIGLELGSVFSRLGSKVFILESAPSILPFLDTNLQTMAKRLLKNLNIQCQAQFFGAQKNPNGMVLEFQTPQGLQTYNVEKVIVAIGRSPNTQGFEDFLDEHCAFLKSDASQKFWAIGDVAWAPMLAHKAYCQANDVAHAILNEQQNLPTSNYANILQVIYTHPEIAFFGSKQGATKTHKTFCASNARALATNQSDGMLQIFTDENNLIVGAQMVGVLASEVLYPILLAKQNNITLEAFKKTMPAHPSFMEMTSSLN